jgi:hypothetical protein
MLALPVVRIFAFKGLVCEAVSATKLRLKGANFYRARLFPLCNWRGPPH